MQCGGVRVCRIHLGREPAVVACWILGVFYAREIQSTALSVRRNAEPRPDNANNELFSVTNLLEIRVRQIFVLRVSSSCFRQLRSYSWHDDLSRSTEKGRQREMVACQGFSSPLGFVFLLQIHKSCRHQNAGAHGVLANSDYANSRIKRVAELAEPV